MKNLLILFVVFASCSPDDINQLNNEDPVSPSSFENKLPAFMIGEFGMKKDQPFTEAGIITITQDSVIINTVNHKQAFRIVENHNFYNPDCSWVITVNGIEYEFTTSSYGKNTWFKFRYVKDQDYTPVGTYYRDYKERDSPEEPGKDEPVIPVMG